VIKDIRSRLSSNLKRRYKLGNHDKKRRYECGHETHFFINNEDQNQFKNMGKDIPSKYHLGTSPKVIMALEE
jgi:hypothetical protein